MRESDFMNEPYAKKYEEAAARDMFPPLSRRFMRSSKDSEYVRKLLAEPSAFQTYMMEELKDHDWDDPTPPKMTKAFGFLE